MGSWEYRPPEVLVAILTREMVTTAWAQRFRDLQLPQSSHVIMLAGMPFDHARNVACERAIEMGYTWLLFLDDDVMPPVDAFARLAQHGKDIISGLYYRRNEPIAPVMLIGRQWITGFQQGAVFEVDLVGAGCLLIHRRVLETMKKSWFEWCVDRLDLASENRLSEDFSFCDKAKREYGFQIWIDTNIQCAHAGIGQAHMGQFKPLTVG